MKLVGNFRNRFMVRVEGLEPPCPKTIEPKSIASANFAIPAYYLNNKSENSFEIH